MKKLILIDVVGLVGAGSITYGVWLISEPSAFLVGGVQCLAWAVLKSRSV